MTKRRLIWEWNNRMDINHVPRWVEIATVVIGFPIVVGLTLLAVFPAFETHEGIAILAGVLALAIYGTVKAKEKDVEGWNHQTIRIHSDSLWYRIGNNEASFELNDIEGNSIEVQKRSTVRVLTFSLMTQGRVVEIPLIGMSKDTVRKMKSILADATQR